MPDLKISRDYHPKHQVEKWENIFRKAVLYDATDRKAVKTLEVQQMDAAELVSIHKFQNINACLASAPPKIGMISDRWAGLTDAH